jgi:MSHA biogenesis protein MshO
MMMRRTQDGFTLVEIIMVIVITGIIGGMVAVFLKAPIQQYLDVARRADMTDIVDTAQRRIGRDLRLALPNSVRVKGVCGGAGTTCFIEFLPTTGGGRYRSDAGAGTLCAAVAGNNEGDALSFDTTDTCFEVLGNMPVPGNFVVVYNMTSNPLDTNPNAYAGGNRAAYSSTAGATMIITAKQFPFDSPGHRFQIITTPVTYACAPATDAAGNGTGTLTRWQGYNILPGQPISLPATGTPSSSILANNVSACTFTYDASVVTQRSGLVTMNLGITESGETVTLYSATHVSNVP